jgi:hypothetical protein
MDTIDSSVYVFNTHAEADEAILEGAALAGGASALGAALTTIGVPKNQVIKYETAVKADKYFLVVHGSAAEAAKARSVLTAPRHSRPPWRKQTHIA